MKSLLPFLFALLLLVSCQSYNSNNESAVARNVSSSTPLADFWNSKAQLLTSATGIGAEFGFHFTHSLVRDGLVYSYFVKSPIYVEKDLVFSTYLATSLDGVFFEEWGEVLSPGNQLIVRSNAASDFLHDMGIPDCGGWLTTTADGPGYHSHSKIFGPVAAGTYHAQFSLSTNPMPGQLANLEVVDAQGKIVAQRTVYEDDIIGPQAPQRLTLNFNVVQDSELELRVYTFGNSNICLGDVSVQPGDGSSRDDRIAAFASPLEKDGTWYLVYEGAAKDENISKGEIRIATSSDGYQFVKDPVPIEIPLAEWSKTNTGTPFLLYERDQWYLFYHGFDGDTVQTGLLTGPDLSSLTPANNNLPVLSNGTGWDAGTVGKRSIIFEDPYYYMVYEGSTVQVDNDFANSSWGVGLARSRDLVNWEKFPGNPVIGTTGAGFGFDGPELIKLPDGSLHVYYRHPNGLTERASFLPR